ncbi:hypothetical protein ANN_18028 [Periplaneta americana]|uniref:DDE-1 domain-containing protein n=1 Tax=Periplaneta americana TaxID=6978 RepID=A0ABQ8SN38_PERAM|nr:hypothetical protein ANN_18028 [Periplaneta americana]
MQYGLTKKDVRQLAYKFAKANGKKYPQSWDEDQIAGEEWMRGFLKIHSSSLSIRKPEATSLSRATSFNRYNVERFFNNVKDVHSRFGPISPEKIWNLDETGLSTVQGQSKIVAPIGSATAGERGQLVTMIAAVNAVGNSLPPMFIFPRVHFKDRMLFGGPAGCIGAANISGWSNDGTFLKFLDHFLGSVKCSKEDRVLLILDNHKTHLSVQALEKASAAGLSWLHNNRGKTFDIYAVAEAAGIAYPKAFTPQNILSGFRKSGIYPLDTEIFTGDDFLGAYVTDRIPSSHPTENVTARPESVEENSRPHITSADLDEPTPGTSFDAGNKRSGSDTPQSKHEVVNIVTPEEVQPYPKATPRKKSNRGRRVGRTVIVTDTPEKLALKKQKEKKKQRNKNIATEKVRHPKKVVRNVAGILKLQPGIKEASRMDLQN